MLRFSVYEPMAVQPIHTLKFSVFKIVDFKMVNANPESGIISPLVFYGFGINKGIRNSHHFQPMFSNDEICWNKKFVFSWIGTARNDTLTFWILIWHFSSSIFSQKMSKKFEVFKVFEIFVKDFCFVDVWFVFILKCRVTRYFLDFTACQYGYFGNILSLKIL